MPRNLRDDYRMYYAGSWVPRVCDGKPQVIYVGDVSYNNHGYNTSDIVLLGQIYEINPRGGAVLSDTNVPFTADQITPFLPESDYYIVGTTPMYLEFQVQNRSNRKGFENARIMGNGQHISLSNTDVIMMILQPDFKGKVFSDICLYRSRVLWRGEDVGSFHDGVLEILPTFAYLQDHIGKQIELFKGRNGGS